MLCVFCSNIDLDLLSTPEGYKHHPSCADLLQSCQNGCESCRLIWKAQWSDFAGDLTHDYDLGPLDTQVVARVVNRKPGDYQRIRYGQEVRKEHYSPHNGSRHDVAFLWAFLVIAAKSGLCFVKMRFSISIIMTNTINRYFSFAVLEFASPSH